MHSFLTLPAAALTVMLLAGPAASQFVNAPADPAWTVPEVGALPDDEHGRLVRRGRDLITATYAHIGPAVADESKRYAGNNLACSNCHLNAGTKKFGLPLWGLWDRFPQYSGEAGGEITIEQRVNSCMTRSMNGKALPLDSPEMAAFAAYIKFLSKDVKPGELLTGLGAGRMPILGRAADPRRGATLYMRACAACHQPDGAGVRRDPALPNFGYLTPPLWGPDSFNNGAGMATLITVANFIHFNMPNGTSYTRPRLTQQEAWDIAAFVISQKRPQRAGLDKDFPDLLQKPADIPYGPYADGFSQTQHMYGPFGPIQAALARMKAQKKN
jgi:thiosulfate dehydrogenase